ncbi:MAG: hypothetical protein ACREYC_00850 [Gammaproteobacteria bacterium]
MITLGWLITSCDEGTPDLADEGLVLVGCDPAPARLRLAFSPWQDRELGGLDEWNL